MPSSFERFIQHGSNELGYDDSLRRSRYLAGSIPPELGLLHDLEILDLSNNEINGAVLRRFHGLQEGNFL